jgi:hypothetical protein
MRSRDRHSVRSAATSLRLAHPAERSRSCCAIEWIPQDMNKKLATAQKSTYSALGNTA